jgi:hypothetical protein
MGFGAKRWLCTLQRQCERIASVLASNIPSAGGDMAGKDNMVGDDGELIDINIYIISSSRVLSREV